MRAPLLVIHGTADPVYPVDHGIALSEAVRGAINELKPKFRLPILLKYIEGLSYEEIAEVMGCSKGTVASRLNRGHSQLAKRLSHLNNPALWGE